jgi:cysteinyl-tRNA synthetase
MKYLGETFDIHTGGIDHLTVHHPNEMAQSKAVTGKLQANYWLHNNFINDKNKKISKSAGAFVRLADIIAGGVNPLAYRYFVLQTHYRKELAYSWDAVKAANQGLKNIYQEMALYQEAGAETLGEYIKKFDEALSDDLNTSKALDMMQQVLKAKRPTAAKLATLFKMDEVLGFGLAKEWERRRKLPAKAEELLAERLKARENKDWKQADILRDKLNEIGVMVMDTGEGQMAALEG